MNRNQVLPTDKEFKDSPDTGRADCICSRCGAKIGAREMPMRVFTGKERNTEYRYCMKCQEKDFGLHYAPDYDEFDEDDFNDEWQ